MLHICRFFKSFILPSCLAGKLHKMFSHTPKREMGGSLLDIESSLLAGPLSFFLCGVPSDVTEFCRVLFAHARLTTHSLRNPNLARSASACSLFVCINRC
jgi:hypothetical protein